MIIIGYQGIGKSTLSKQDMRFIDLESGNFWVDGKRADDWYKPYCQIAEHLSQQGYVVFTSSHAVVREQLKNSKEDVRVVVPALTLKEPWIKRLEERYNDSKLEKDFKALANAKVRYTENIQEIMDSGFDIILIESMNYNLEKLITGKVVNKRETKSDETYRIRESLKHKVEGLYKGTERLSDIQITNDKLDNLTVLLGDIAMSLANIVDVAEKSVDKE